ncbi:phosphate-binding protein [Gemmatimonadetes bacterium T265]|nr:phosphate-binding protein [Gemmatimonadetes bacterium T265]
MHVISLHRRATTTFRAVAASAALSVAATLAAPATAHAQDLTGAGSTFAYPLYSRWASDYAAKAGVKVNYQSIGSGGGIRQLSEQTVDFGATDAPMSAQELAAAKGGPILHVPVAMGAVLPVYNLPGVTQPLHFTGDVLSGIYLGKITKWNDPQLAALNRGVRLPDTDILVIHRSDGSGTTYIWTDYLSTVSPGWKQQVGTGKDVKWPVGLGGKGNEGVAGQVKQTPGAIGYVELAYARQNKLPLPYLRNAAGQYVLPTPAGVTAAAAAVAKGLPANTDYRISIINAPGAAAYPISSMTWALIYTTQKDPAKGRKLLDFLRYGLTEGQQSAAQLDYAPLPANLAMQLRKRLGAVTVAAR